MMLVTPFYHDLCDCTPQLLLTAPSSSFRVHTRELKTLASLLSVCSSMVLPQPSPVSSSQQEMGLPSVITA